MDDDDDIVHASTCDQLDGPLSWLTSPGTALSCVAEMAGDARRSVGDAARRTRRTVEGIPGAVYDTATAPARSAWEAVERTHDDLIEGVGEVGTRASQLGRDSLDAVASAAERAEGTVMWMTIGTYGVVALAIIGVAMWYLF